MCDCLLQSSVSLSFLGLSISRGSMDQCSGAFSRLSSRQDTVSPTDTACSSESPAFLAGPASHLLMYDQNSSEEELEVINGGGGILEGGSSSAAGNDAGGGASSGNDGGGASARSTASEGGLRSAESSESVLSAIAATSSGGGGNRCSSLVGIRAPSVTSDSEEGLEDELEEELCLVSESPVPIGGGPLRPVAITPSRGGPVGNLLGGHGPSMMNASVGGVSTSSGATSKQQQRCSSNNLLEKRKRSLAHSSDDEVRQLLEQQHNHYHHHHHHLHHQQPLMSAPPVNFRTSPPLEALKPHNRGGAGVLSCILQRSTTPLILTESGRGLEHIRISSSSSISSTASSLSSLGGTGNGAGSSGLFGAGLPSSCDSPLAVLVNSHHQHQQHHQHLHQSSQNSNNNNNNLALLSTTSNTTNMTPTGNGGSCTTSNPSTSTSPMPMPLGTLVQNTSAAAIGASGGGGGGMEISRSVSPPAKVFHCAVSPRRRQTGRHQQSRLQRPHRPCLDFDKMQQVSIYRFDTIPRSRGGGFTGSAFAGWKCAAV
ncbi:protein lingerer-like isoform X4 [Uranotaenia lowii]|uniref:protein lingerer-like isoform X4 n=1 Tax=Uranotaenia lowii TaxID=190385 RepID=UPI00247955C4|nr:protein lingerer-like isoform X4 [Uranotaenia lowii]